MTNTAPEFTLAELAITAASEIFRDETPEVFATLIGTLPKLAGYLAKETFLPGMMMSDGIYYLAAEPVPLGPRPGYQIQKEGRIGYERVFTVIARGERHAFVGPVQVDRYGQMNLSCIGDYEKPKVTMLGVRGLPGNTVNNRTSMFFASHNKRALVADEVDMVSGAGYNPSRYPDNTGFDLVRPDNIPETQAPTQAQLDIIAKYDPHNLRAYVFKDNPAGRRSA